MVSSHCSAKQLQALAKARAAKAKNAKTTTRSKPIVNTKVGFGQLLAMAGHDRDSDSQSAGPVFGPETDPTRKPGYNPFGNRKETPAPKPKLKAPDPFAFMFKDKPPKQAIDPFANMTRTAAPAPEPGPQNRKYARAIRYANKIGSGVKSFGKALGAGALAMYNSLKGVEERETYIRYLYESLFNEVDELWDSDYQFLTSEVRKSLEAKNIELRSLTKIDRKISKVLDNHMLWRIEMLTD